MKQKTFLQKILSVVMCLIFIFSLCGCEELAERISKNRNAHFDVYENLYVTDDQLFYNGANYYRLQRFYECNLALVGGEKIWRGSDGGGYFDIVGKVPRNDIFIAWERVFACKQDIERHYLIICGDVYIKEGVELLSVFEYEIERLEIRGLVDDPFEIAPKSEVEIKQTVYISDMISETIGKDILKENEWVASIWFDCLKNMFSIFARIYCRNGNYYLRIEDHYSEAFDYKIKDEYQEAFKTAIENLKAREDISAE